jgi:putative ABC transport system ATP-binding protein
MSESLLRAEGLTKTYHLGRTQVAALRGVSLEVKRGEFLCVMGPPGAGKSTLMHLLGLLDVPTTGRLIVNGQDALHLTQAEQADLRLRSMGFVFQSFNLLRELTALENVMLPMLIRGHSAEQSRKRAERLLETVGLAERLQHRPGELSGGQQQRVAIARALANEPDLVLADEPTGRLDSKTGAAIRELFGNLNREQRQSLVVVSHEKEWAVVAQRVIHLRDGRIVD